MARAAGSTTAGKRLLEVFKFGWLRGHPHLHDGRFRQQLREPRGHRPERELTISLALSSSQALSRVP